MYQPTTWIDHIAGVQEGTDMNAEHFNNMEAGIMEANALAALHFEHQKAAESMAPIESTENPGCYFRWVTEKPIEGNSFLREEWVNPPLKPGIEYRTTDRFNGNPVYVQAFVNSRTIKAGDVEPLLTNFDNVELLNGMDPLVTGFYGCCRPSKDVAVIPLSDCLVTLSQDKKNIHFSYGFDVSDLCIVMKYIKTYGVW